MNMKRFFSAITAVAIAAGSVPAVERGSVSAAAVADDGSQVDDSFLDGDLRYSVLEDGTLSVICPSIYKSTITKAVIPSEVRGRKVTQLGAFAFDGCSRLTEVTIPDSITSMVYAAFRDCTSLTKVTIPDSVTELGFDAFTGCTSLSEVTISKNLERLETDAFKDCTSLREVTIPDGVKIIDVNAFGWCTGLTDVTIPDSVLYIGNGAFIGCTSLSEVTVPKNVEEIDNYAFSGCTGLTAVTIPKSVTYIGMYAFDGCDALKDVYYAGTDEQWVFLHILFGQNNDSLFNADIHYESTGPLKIRIPKPDKDAPETADVRATVTVGEEEVTLTINEDGVLDTSDVPDGTYTFTFSASNCAPKEYEVTVEGGTVSGLEGGVKLHLFGDVNGDGVVNTQDVAKANAHVKGTSTLTGYELTCINVNSDKNINVQDVALMNAHAKNTKKLW